MKRLAKILILGLTFGAAPALAAQPVSLKPVIAASGQVTLGDIFDGAGAAGGVVVAAHVPAGGSLSLNASDVHRLAMLNGLTWANEDGLRRILVHGGAAPAAATSAAPARATSAVAPPSAQRGVEVLTFARNLNPGDIVQPEDLVWGVVAAAPSGAVDDPDRLIGKAANRAIRAGAAATARDVSAPQVVKRDDIITVTFNQGGVRLELQAKAKEAAAIGETLSVVNLTSNKVFQAVASGPGRAVVGPEADRLRAAAITNPSSLALR